MDGVQEMGRAGRLLWSASELLGGRGPTLGERGTDDGVRCVWRKPGWPC